jgi:hypothetical protein
MAELWRAAADNPAMRPPIPAGFVLLMLGLSACQPTLNWREARPAGAGVVALFPCKPEVDQRPGMGLAHCEAGGRRFSLSWADTPDVSQTGAALSAMAQALAGKLGQPLPAPQPVQVRGMTPLPQAAQYRIGGADAVHRLAVFAHGGRVYQALASGKGDDAPAWDSFVGGLGIEPAR